MLPFLARIFRALFFFLAVRALTRPISYPQTRLPSQGSQLCWTTLLWPFLLVQQNGFFPVPRFLAYSTPDSPGDPFSSSAVCGIQRIRYKQGRKSLLDPFFFFHHFPSTYSHVMTIEVPAGLRSWLIFSFSFLILSLDLGVTLCFSRYQWACDDAMLFSFSVLGLLFLFSFTLSQQAFVSSILIFLYLAYASAWFRSYLFFSTFYFLPALIEWTFYLSFPAGFFCFVSRFALCFDRVC